MNNVKKNFKSIVVAPITSDNSTGTDYGTVFSIKNGVSLALTATNVESSFSGDDVVVVKESANNGYTGTLTSGDLPVQFLTEILKWTTDADGAIYENANAAPVECAIGFEVGGDISPTRYWLYRVVVGRAPINATTKTDGQVTYSTAQLPITVLPRVSDNEVKVEMTKTTENSSKFDAFFLSVREKVAPTE